MKTPSDNLFQLIKSLKSKVKRQFKRVSVNQNKKPDYIVLFDCIDVMNDFDNTILTKKLVKKGIYNNISYLKNYLQKQLIDFLEDYYNDFSTDIILKKILIKVEILFEKKLISLAKLQLKKAEKLVEEKQKLYYLFEVNFLKNQLYGNQKQITLKNEFVKNNDFSLQFLIEQKLYQLDGFITSIFKKTGQDYNPKIEVQLFYLTQQFSLKDIEKINTDIGRFYFNFFYGNIFFLRKDYTKAYEHYNNANHLIIKIDISPRKFIIFYSRFVIILKLLNFINKIEDIKKIVENYITKLPSKRQTESILNAYAVFTNNLIASQIESLKIEYALESISNYSEIHAKYASFQGQIVNFYYKIIIYFFLKNYQLCLKNINYILNSDMKIRLDILFFSKIMFLLTHYELKNYEIIPNYASMFLNDYQKAKREDEFELMLLNLFYENDFLMLTNYQKEQLFFNCRTEIIAKNIKENPSYFYLTEWLTSKIANRSFAEVVKESYEQKMKLTN